MSSFEKIAAYLEAHPTPWRFIREIYADTPLGPPSSSEMGADGYHKARVTRGETRDVVEDANGNIVFSSWDRDEWSSHIEGDVRSLADFVNLVGNDYEPPCGWPGVDYGPIEPVDPHDLYEYGVTYTMRDGTEERIEWCEHTGDAELDRQIIRSRVANWRKAGQDPKVVRRRVGAVEQEPPEGWFGQRPRLRPVD